jgi:hypothetical protein
VASSTIAYHGLAAISSAANAAVWQIRRLTTNVAGSITVEYADGNATYDNVWDNRAALAYS